LKKKNDSASSSAIRSEDVKLVFRPYLTKIISLRDQVELSEVEGNESY